MPYDRGEVITSTTEFYKFLVNHVNFTHSNLRTPPPDGWSHISPAGLAFMRKSNEIVELLRHMPYLECYPEDEDVVRKEIWPHTVCVDYSDVEKVKRASEIGDRDLFEPIEEVAENCPWEPLTERNEDVVAIGKPECGDKGSFIHLDTTTGEVVIWDVMGGETYFENAKECFEHLRRQFELLEVFAVPDTVVPLSNEGDEVFKGIVRSLGWPPAREGKNGQWKREEGMKEVKRVWP